LRNYIASGSVVALQEFFADATDGFDSLVRIACGQEVGGVVPTIDQQLKAMGMMLDKAFPSLKATHVTQHHVAVKDKEVDTDAMMLEIEALMRDVKELDK